MEEFVKESFFKEAFIQTIHNGIDVSIFSPKDTHALRDHLGIENKHVVLGVAMPWNSRKGLEDMFRLADLLSDDEYQVMTVGLSDKQVLHCPKNVIGIKRTSNALELAEYYSLASVFVNPTYEDNYPTTNLEAIACGTPVITYRTGGSPESVSPETGSVVDQGDVAAMAEAIKDVCGKDRREYISACRKRAEEYFDKDKCFEDYISLYESTICAR